MKNENIKIAGIQKLTLLDYPEKTSAILFLPGCNMNCPFCQNSELIHNTVQCMDNGEVMAFLEKRKNLLDGIVITGGEPLLQDVSDFCQTVKRLGYTVKLDTNGLNPDRLESLIQNNLIDYIAMDVKNSPSRYSSTAGVPVDMDKIMTSVRLIISSGLPYEFRTTVTPSLHTVEDIADICINLIPNAENYCIQPFELSDDVPDKTLAEPTDDMLLAFYHKASEFIPHVSIKGRDLIHEEDNV